MINNDLCPNGQHLPISVLVTALNEEANIEDCLKSVRPWAGEVCIVDGGSEDQTVKIAKRYGARVEQSLIRKISDLKNWALEHLPFSYEWVLILDADERVSTPLWEEIADVLENNGKGYDGFYLNRRFIFCGRWMKHSWYPSWNLRLFKHRLGRYEDRMVHEHMVLHGRIGFCRNDLFHEDHRDLNHWIEKHNRYSAREAQEYLNQIRGEKEADTAFDSLPLPLKVKRWIKLKIWPHVPGRALFYFVYLYFLKLGFLDGAHGFRFCVMHAVFEHFSALKLWELRKYKKTPTSRETELPSAFWAYEEFYRERKSAKMRKGLHDKVGAGKT